jgi:hypothetical protein
MDMRTPENEGRLYLDYSCLLRIGFVWSQLPATSFQIPVISLEKLGSFVQIPIVSQLKTDYP